MKAWEKEMEVCHIGHELKLRSRGPRQTMQFGKELGCLCAPGDVICLSGELGAGKTIMAKGIAQGLAVPKSYEIVSPSFTLINEFPGRIPLYHMDFYRIQGPDEAEEIGVVDYLFGNGISLIEWPERIISLLSKDYLLCEIRIKTKRMRDITLFPEGKRAEALLDNLYQKFENRKKLKIED